ncbi:hypothetical protein VHEMI09362 [[Torrubiella] hemipterigena]|uniref:UBX domain-containing protein n=1 Tax=[Torrubiella] hemipterigena TaxID=1531966 RepID=A0A0A1TQ75_9HYPO|nr:hypothetical protein VHEMI09362 [[Torrubiella] hemipterigena]
MDEEASTFVAITGSSDEVARGFLELAGGNFERAVEMFYENPDLVSGMRAGASTTAAASSGRPQRQGGPSTSRKVGREDASGVIHISDDDDDDDGDEYMEMDDDIDSDNNHDDDAVAAAHAANMAQEEEDAAMAKRLQEELYQQGGAGPAGEDVRAPIARTTETLIAPNASWGDDDDDADMQHAFLEQLRRRQRANQRTAAGPFSQGIWSDGNPLTGSRDSSSHSRRLEDLFRPPHDLMARLEWEEARQLGKEDKKWILVNLQDMSDFNCQALNRDIWKDEAIRELVKENFLFLQYDKDYPDAQEYITFYFPNRGHENPDNYPHVSIVDPRTGEQVKVWSGRPFPKAAEFHAELAEFLDRYSLAANSKNPVAKAGAPKPKVIDVDRMTEEEMLEMALKNSMAGASGSTGESSGAASTPNIVDPDSLTKATATTHDGAQDAEMEADESDEFAQIASDEPHSEPDNNPATTTRIQFRHPTGRVIRRFAVADPVRRIFEWLKAEPLEGYDGVKFELKKMPQGQDLLGSLDASIEESGLKQGTVMIEFIQD